MISTAIKAAKAAGKILMDHYGRVNNISVKKDSSLVTEVDAACEQKIREIILSKYPNHSIVGEEGGDDKKDSEYKWIIDPLDGTHNYVFKFPMFGVSIGFAYRNNLVGGVIYFPLSKEMYVAEKGKWCFLNGKRLFIKDKPLKESMISFSTQYSRNVSEETQKVVKKVVDNCFDVRVSGCAVYNISGVLNNTFGVMLSRKNKDWDVAAGVVMIREAGGVATDYNGKDWSLGELTIVAGNKVAHKEVLELLA